MRAVILISFLMQVHGKEVETNQIDDTEDMGKLVDELVQKVGADELANKMVDKLSDRVFGASPLEDADLDGTTLGKPAQAAGLNTLSAVRPVQPLLARSRPVSNAMQQNREEELARRSMLTSLALMPLVAIAGEAAAADNLT